jgi:hypothetical protein
MSDNNDLQHNGWNQWSKFVLMELKRLNHCYEDIDRRLQDVQKDMAALKVKSGFWGLLGGLIPVGIALLVWLIKGEIGSGP